jgi:hypothetical protein
VISIEAMQPAMTILIELGDTGEGVVVKLGDLRRCGPTG